MARLDSTDNLLSLAVANTELGKVTVDLLNFQREVEEAIENHVRAGESTVDTIRRLVKDAETKAAPHG